MNRGTPSHRIGFTYDIRALETDPGSPTFVNSLGSLVLSSSTSSGEARFCTRLPLAHGGLLAGGAGLYPDLEINVDPAV